MKRWQKRLSVGVSVIATLGLLSACTSSEKEQTPVGDIKGGTMTIRLKQDWDTLDPYQSRTAYGLGLSLSFYDRLVTLDSSGKVAPYLAESWAVSADTATFKIRQGVTCADNTPLTPTAIADSLKRMGATETKAPFAARIFGSAGYTVSADDNAQTVTVKTNKPFSELLLGLTQPWAGIICPAGLKDSAKLASEPAGSGPFILEKSVRGDSYTLTTRKNYTWGPGGSKTSDPGYPEKLIYRVVTNETTAANLLSTKEVDLSVVTGQDLQRVASDKSLLRVDGQAFGVNFIVFNQAAGRVTVDQQVRTAIAQAIDSAAFNQASVFGQGTVATSVVTEVVPCYDQASKGLVQPFDLAKAKQTLEQAGFRAGTDGKLAKDGKPLSLHVVGYEAQNSGPEYVLDALTKLGATVKLTSKDINTLTEIAFKTGDFDLVILPYAASMPTLNGAATYLMGAAPPKGTNAGSLQLTGFETAVMEALAATPDQRCGHWATAQQELLKNVAIKPLNAETHSWFGHGIKFGLFTSLIIDPHSIRRVK